MAQFSSGGWAPIPLPHMEAKQDLESQSHTLMMKGKPRGRIIVSSAFSYEAQPQTRQLSQVLPLVQQHIVKGKMLSVIHQ